MTAKQQGWIGVDLDGTLAHYDGWQGADHIGPPVPLMLERVKRWLAEGREVRIFTARISDGDEAVYEAIRTWCYDHIGRYVSVTNIKDQHMIELWDDRCVQVIPNTGMPVGASTRGLD